MFIPYITLFKGDTEVEVTNTKWSGEKTTVRIEEPNAVLGFKVLECNLPSYTILKNVGLLFLPSKYKYDLRI